MIKSRLVSTFLRFYRPLGCSLVDLTKFSCPRLSVELDPYRGVVDWPWFSPRSSNRPVFLCECSQEAVLVAFGG